MAHQTAQYRHRVRVPRLEDPAFHPLCADRQLEDQAVQIAHNRNPALHRNTKTELTRAERMIPRKHDVPNSAFAAPSRSVAMASATASSSLVATSSSHHARTAAGRRIFGS